MSTERKAPIVVCIPWLKATPRHMEHMTEWYAINKAPHNILRLRMFYTALHKVQRRAVDVAKKAGASHVLFTEDDQWGYPVDGLDVLLEADRDVVGFRSYFKRYPYLSMAFRKKDASISMIGRVPNFNQLEPAPGETVGELPAFWQVEGSPDGEDIHEVDLLSWAFTLVKMSVFDRMEEAGYDPFRQWGPVPTDSFFAHYCEVLGIPRYVHFAATIGHGDVGPDEIPAYRKLHESVNAMRYTRALRLVMEDDFGHTYGEAEYLPEAARAIKEYREGARDDREGATLDLETPVARGPVLHAPPGNQDFSVVREREPEAARQDV